MVSTSVLLRPELRLLGELLDYPHEPPAEVARELVRVLAPENPEAAELAAEFAEFAEQTPLGALQEAYTHVFDLDSSCYPYLGYHILGETYLRSQFLVELSARYKPHGIDDESIEVPDHLPQVLRYLAVCEEEEATTIVDEALRPTLEKMLNDRGEEPTDGSEVSDAGAAVQIRDGSGPASEPRRPDQNQYRELLLALRALLGDAPPDPEDDDEDLTTGEIPQADSLGV